MAEKVYELLQFRSKEAWRQASKEEKESFHEKIIKARDDVGGERLAFFPTYSSEWRAVRVSVFPDMEAYHKYQMVAFREMNAQAQKYFESNVTLGYEPPT